MSCSRYKLSIDECSFTRLETRQERDLACALGCHDPQALHKKNVSEML